MVHTEPMMVRILHQKAICTIKTPNESQLNSRRAINGSHEPGIENPRRRECETGLSFHASQPSSPNESDEQLAKLRNHCPARSGHASLLRESLGR